MKPAIIASKKDKAGMNIAEELEKSGFKLNYTEKEIIYAENIDEKFKDVDFLIFISKHQGAKPKILSVHAPGNWGKAEFGGKPNQICKTSATVLKTFFKKLSENLPQGWNLTLEATHHGPYIETPCLFIEIGSSEKDWKNKQAGKAVAKTIENSIKKLNQNHKYKISIGIGGPHYCPNFNKIQLNSDIAISHIIPQYVFPITQEMIRQAIERTEEKVDLVLLDWKGMKGEQRQNTIKILNKMNLKYKKTSDIKNE